jgi:hypothetical protein
MREWAVKLEAKPKYVVSSTRKDFPWTNSHHIGGDLRAGVQRLKDATPTSPSVDSERLKSQPHSTSRTAGDNRTCIARSNSDWKHLPLV